MANADVFVTSSCRFSTRISIRWLPDPAYENTDTVVMSVQDWYVDLRMDKATGAIDWAIAGQRLIESQDPLRVSFTHELDSHNAFESADCGTFVSLPNGDDLETGSMPHPDITGNPVMDYEEVWRELPFKEGPEGSKKGMSWILESDNGHVGDQEGEFEVDKVFLGRIWGTYLALGQRQTLLRRKDASGGWTVKKSAPFEVNARREEWEGSGWDKKYEVGPAGSSLPSMITGFSGEGEGSWRVPGEKVLIGDKSFIVRAFEEIQ